MATQPAVSNDGDRTPLRDRVGAPSAQQEVARSLGWLINLRWLAGAGVVLATALATEILGIGLPARRLYLVGAGVLAFNVVFRLTLAWIDRRRADSLVTYEWFARTQIGVDWLGMAVLIELSGGIESPVLAFFLFHITIASLLLPPRRGYLYVALAPALVATVAFVDYRGLAPQVAVFGGSRVHDPVYVGSALFVFACACYLLAYFSMSIAERLRRRESELRGLFESVRDTSSTLEIAEVLQRLTVACARVLQCKGAVIRLLDPRREHLETVARHGLSQAYVEKGPIEVGRASIDRDVLGGRTVLVPDVSRDARVQYPEQARAEGIVAMLTAPLVGKTGVIGVLRAYGGPGHRFTERDAIFLASLGAHGAVAIENATAYELLRDLEGRKTRFVRTVTHELRSPVEVARTILSVLVDGYVGELAPQQTDMIGRALRKIEYLQAVVDDLLDPASAKSALLADAEQQAVRLDTVVVNACARYEAPLRNKGLTLTCEPGGDLLVAWAHPGEFDLVLDHLLSNALKYTVRGGVRVSAEPVGQSARIIVADTGIGIPEAARPHLFEEFYRADNARAADAKGTGLGLAVVNQVVERYGGRVTVDSALGVGTTVTLDVPLARATGDRSERARG